MLDITGSLGRNKNKIFTSSSLPVIIKLMKKFFKFIIVFLIITGWIFSGFPRVFNPSTLFRTSFPLKIQKA